MMDNFNISCNLLLNFQFSGGYNGSKDLSSGEYYDPLSNSWQMMSCNMNSRRSCLGISTLNGLIYVRYDIQNEIVVKKMNDTVFHETHETFDCSLQTFLNDFFLLQRWI